MEREQVSQLHQLVHNFVLESHMISRQERQRMHAVCILERKENNAYDAWDNGSSRSYQRYLGAANSKLKPLCEDDELLTYLLAKPS